MPSKRCTSNQSPRSSFIHSTMPLRFPFSYFAAAAILVLFVSTVDAKPPNENVWMSGYGLCGFQENNCTSDRSGWMTCEVDYGCVENSSATHAHFTVLQSHVAESSYNDAINPRYFFVAGDASSGTVYGLFPSGFSSGIVAVQTIGGSPKSVKKFVALVHYVFGMHVATLEDGTRSLVLLGCQQLPDYTPGQCGYLSLSLPLSLSPPLSAVNSSLLYGYYTLDWQRVTAYGVLQNASSTATERLFIVLEDGEYLSAREGSHTGSRHSNGPSKSRYPATAERSTAMHIDSGPSEDSHTSSGHPHGSSNSHYVWYDLNNAPAGFPGKSEDVVGTPAALLAVEEKVFGWFFVNDEQQTPKGAYIGVVDLSSGTYSPSSSLIPNVSPTSSVQLLSPPNAPNLYAVASSADGCLVFAYTVTDDKGDVVMDYMWTMDGADGVRGLAVMLPKM